ncbi:MAG: S8 family serine peptidase [Chitinispirillaceae bacterium]|nr:S8 family serine peptidase [Chitinispirillaceae bacterium]
MKVCYLFVMTICITAFNGFGRIPSHKGYYSTKKVEYRVSKAHLIRAAKDVQSEKEPTQKAILYTRRQLFPEAYSEYGIKIINQSGCKAIIEYRSSLKPFLYALDDVIHVQYPRQLYSVLDTTRILCRINDAHSASLPRYTSGPYKGKNVLIGIIDTEFDTRHPAFLDSNSITRFIAIWDQTDSLKANNNKYNYGTIKNTSELSSDTLFGTKGHFHGTLMAAAATGSDIQSGFYGVAPEAYLAGVCYDYSNDFSLMDAIKWIFSLADSLDVPCVISMSIGVASGPHDGTSELDAQIDNVSGPGRIIVGAAGNDGDSRTHVLFDLKADSHPQGTWITPQSNTSEKDTLYSFRVDVWGEFQKSFQLSTQVYNSSTDSLHEDTNFLTISSRRSMLEPDTLFLNGDTIRLYVHSDPLDSKPHAEILAITNKPEYHIGIRVKSTKDTRLHCWNVYKKSLESLDMKDFIGGDNNYSINEVGGTAKRIIAVGSYLGRSAIKLWNGELVAGAQTDTVLKLAGFSGRGPTVDGRIKPDITAPGNRVFSAMSSHTDDYGKTVYWPFHPQPYGWYGAATGTSISAPIVAGTIALLLQVNPQLSPEQVRTALQASAIKDQFTGSLESPDNSWGGGKLNTIGAIDHVLGLPSTTLPRQFKTHDKLLITYKSEQLYIKNLPAKATLELIDLRGRVLQSTYGVENSIKKPQAGGPCILLCKVDGQTVFSKKIILTH